MGNPRRNKLSKIMGTILISIVGMVGFAADLATIWDVFGRVT